MNRTMTIILAVLAAMAGLWLAYRIADSLYFTPRAVLARKIDDASGNIGKYRKAEREHGAVQAEIAAIVDRTLGGDLENVHHRLRTRLNRLAEQCQLQGVSVGTSPSGKAKESPAKRKFRNTPSQRLLRDEKDFVELEGWVAGTGSFEQVLRLVDGVESEPWIKRIDELKLDPKDNGERFDVTVRLTTLFLPNRHPNEANLASAGASGFERYLALVQTNPFRVPPPPAPPPPPEPKPSINAAPLLAPAYAYEQWALTGVAQGPSGPEIWLLNQQTKESRRLGKGDGLHEIVFVAAAGDAAEFRQGDQRFLVAVGKNLHDRTPVKQ